MNEAGEDTGAKNVRSPAGTDMQDHYRSPQSRHLEKKQHLLIIVKLPISMFLVGFQPTLAISRGFEPPAG